MTAKEEFGDIQNYIDYMQGTCNSFDYDGWSMEELEQFDECLFECSICGWYCEAGDWNVEACEATGENVCSECDA